MVAIQRRDNLMWAIPGGMVDAGEKATSTLKREFIEEAMNRNTGINHQIKTINKQECGQFCMEKFPNF